MDWNGHKGIPPTSKKVSFGGMGFSTIIDGKITEEWATADMMGLMQQIEPGGINPAMIDT
jgi:predicted ester cyclase